MKERTRNRLVIYTVNVEFMLCAGHIKLRLISVISVTQSLSYPKILCLEVGLGLGYFAI